MAGDRINIGGIELDVRADGSLLIADLKKAEQQAKAFTSAASASLKEGLGSALTGVRNQVLAIFSAQAVVGFSRGIIEAADAFSSLRSRLSLVVKEGEDLLQIEERLSQMAVRNRADLESTISLYTRIRSARADLSDDKAQKIVDTWSKALVISGASAQAAAASTTQFSQALAGGVLRAEEFNSITENNSRAVQLFAQSMGVSTGELRKLVNEGKVGFNEMVKALTEDTGEIDGQFASMKMTVSQAMTNIQTAFMRFVGLADQGAGASEALAVWINTLAENFDVLAKIAIAAGAAVATSLSISTIAGMAAALKGLAVSMATAGASAKALGAAMSFLGGPWGALLGVIVGSMVLLNGALEKAEEPAKRAADAIQQMKDRIAETDAVIARAKGNDLASPINDVGAAAKDAADKVDTLNSKLREFAQTPKGQALQGQLVDNRQLEWKIQDAEGDLAAAQEGRNSLLRSRGLTEVNLKAADDKIAQLKAGIEEMKVALAAGLQRAEEIRTADADLFGSDDGRPDSFEDAKYKRYSTAAEDYAKAIDSITSSKTSDADKSRGALQAVLDYAKAVEDTADALERLEALAKRGVLSSDDFAIGDRLIREAHDKRVADEGLPTLPVDGEAIDADMQAEWDKAYSDLYGDPNREPPELPKDYWAGYETNVRDAIKSGLYDAVMSGDASTLIADVFADAAGSGLARAIDQSVDRLFQQLSEFDWATLFGEGGFSSGLNSLFDFFGAPSTNSSGGDMRAGGVYGVNELGREIFVPSVNGFMIPNRSGARASSEARAPTINIGDTNLVINGNADAATREELAAVLDAHRRALPGLIDAQVGDRMRRGTYG